MRERVLVIQPRFLAVAREPHDGRSGRPGMNVADRDIASRADIVRLVDGFYARVRADEILGPIFDGIARTDWGRHLPRMYDFWEAVLFGASGFHGNPLAVHRELATRVPLGEREFGRWLALFHESVDALFRGPRADDTKVRASRIAAVMRHHILADVESAAAV